MSMKAALATIADLEEHPGRAELIHGELIGMSPTGFEHGRVASRIVWLLSAFSSVRKAGVVLTCDPDFIRDAQNVRAPDVAVVGIYQAKAAPTRGFMTFAPRLVMEVVSPSDAWSDVRVKVRGWLAHGTAVVWVVDPSDQTVEVAVSSAAPREHGVARIQRTGERCPLASAVCGPE